MTSTSQKVREACNVYTGLVKMLHTSTAACAVADVASPAIPLAMTGLVVRPMRPCTGHHVVSLTDDCTNCVFRQFYSYITLKLRMHPILSGKTHSNAVQEPGTRALMWWAGRLQRLTLLPVAPSSSRVSTLRTKFWSFKNGSAQHEPKLKQTYACKAFSKALAA